MVDDLALGVDAAGAGAGVAALVVDAGLVGRALRVLDALGPAAGHVGVAEVPGHACAGGGAVPVRADGVGAARGGIAGSLDGSDWKRENATVPKRIQVEV